MRTIESRSLNEHERAVARGCLVTLAVCGLSAAVALGVVAYQGWWLEALSLVGILLVIAALRSERGREDLGSVSEGCMRRHRP